MHFSVFLNARSMSPEQDRGLIQDLMAHVDLADELGFDAIFLPDHHFTGYMPIASDPFLFAAFLAATHKRMHFGFSVTSVPLHNPIRFVERINILDQLTDGKILVGIGSGTTPEEMIGFGVNYKEASKVAEENLAIADQLWAKTMTSGPAKFDTGHYKGEGLAAHSARSIHTWPCPADAGGDEGGKRAARCRKRLASVHSRLHSSADWRSRTDDSCEKVLRDLPHIAVSCRPFQGTDCGCSLLDNAHLPVCPCGADRRPGS